MLLVAFCNWLDSRKVKSYDVTIQVRSDLHRTTLLFTIFCFQEIIHGGSLKFYTLWAVRPYTSDSRYNWGGGGVLLI